jgi:hypothetical protein
MYEYPYVFNFLVYFSNFAGDLNVIQKFTVENSRHLTHSSKVLCASSVKNKIGFVNPFKLFRLSMCNITLMSFLPLQGFTISQ